MSVGWCRLQIRIFGEMLNYVLCFLVALMWWNRRKHPGNRQISTSTFQKHILLLVGEVCEKSSEPRKRVGEGRKSTLQTSLDAPVKEAQISCSK